MIGKKLIAVIFLIALFPYIINAETLKGTGYGKTMDEAKNEALSDLSQSIRVRVFSKYEQTALKDNDKVSVNSLKYTKLSANVPLISPSVIYSRENGLHKATASIDNPNKYAEKLSEIAENIDKLTAEVKENGSRSLNYRLLRSAENLYGDYADYKAVADALGIKGYKEPRISQPEAAALILSMQETPPSLEVAAQALTDGMTERDIYVYPPSVAGNGEITEFGVFFKDLLSAKVNSVKVEEDGKYKLICSYQESAGDIIMTCGLITGVSKTLKSSVTKIPKELLAGMDALPKKNIGSILNSYTHPKTDYKIRLKISTDGDPSFLRENEPFTVLVKANKAGYLYFVSYNNSEYGQANILSLGWNNEFIKYISEKDINKWVSLGQFRVKAPFGSETLQAFALSEKPDPKYILPEYAQNNIGYLKNIRPEVLMEDIIYLFQRQTCDKTMASVTYATAPNRK